MEAMNIDDAGTAMSLDEGGKARFYAGITALIVITQCIFSMEFISLNVALPSVVRSLGIDPALTSWVISSYLLAYGGFLVLGGELADRFGRRRYCILGLTLFGVGAIVSAFAADGWVFFAANAVAGFGTALFSPVSFSFINILLPEGPVRNRAFSLFGITQGIVQIAGFGGAGFIITGLGWRAVFLVDLPLVAIAIILAVRLIPRHKPVAHGASVDIGGAVLITLSSILALVALTNSAKFGWGSWQCLGLLSGAVVALLMFLVLEKRLKNPLVPPGLYRTQNFLGGSIACSGMFAATGCIYGLLELFLQKVLNFSAATAGVAMLPYSVMFIVVGRIIGRGMSKYPLRRTIYAGFIAMAIGCAAPVFLAADHRYAVNILPGLLLIGVGVGSLLPLLMALATANISLSLQGIGTGMLMTIQQVGLALGASVGFTIVAAGAKAGAPVLTAFHHGFLSAAMLDVIGLVITILFTRDSAMKPSARLH